MVIITRTGAHQMQLPRSSPCFILATNEAGEEEANAQGELLQCGIHKWFISELVYCNGAALVLTTVFHTSAVFHITFVLLMILAVPCSMWLYHAVILPRRKRCKRCKQGIPR